MQIGRGFVTGKYCRIEAGDILANKNENKNLIIGQNVQINDFCHFTAYERVEIGDNVLIASKVYISDVSHGQYGEDAVADSPLTIPQGRKLISNPVKIESNVWLGEGVCVLPGVTIGCGSIIGANAVVNATIPPYCIAVGVPAKVVKKYSIEQKKWIKVVNE